MRGRRERGRGAWPGAWPGAWHKGEGLATDCLARHTSCGWSCLPNTTYLHHSKQDTLLLRGSAAFLPSRWEVLTTTLDSLPRRQECPSAPPAGRLPRLRQSRSPPARPPAAGGARGSCSGTVCLLPGASLLRAADSADTKSRYRGLNMQCECT